LAFGGDHSLNLPVKQKLPWCVLEEFVWGIWTQAVSISHCSNFQHCQVSYNVDCAFRNLDL